MKRYRRLRRLVPDEELMRRRAAGEDFRGLAVDYGVAHTTLGRYFARPSVANELKAVRRMLRGEQAVARRAKALQDKEERALARKVYREAARQALLERERLDALARALLDDRSHKRPRSAYEARLNAPDVRQPWIRKDFVTRNDDRAAAAVQAGGGWLRCSRRQAYALGRMCFDRFTR
jgi:hypothetical protein